MPAGRDYGSEVGDCYGLKWPNCRWPGSRAWRDDRLRSLSKPIGWPEQQNGGEQRSHKGFLGQNQPVGGDDKGHHHVGVDLLEEALGSKMSGDAHGPPLAAE